MHKKIISVAIFFFSAVVFSQEPKNLGSLFYKEVTADIETEPVFVADDAADDMCVLENKTDPDKSLIISSDKKYGIRDYRGGGRSSARETAARVAAGAIAKVVLQKKLGKKFNVIGAVTQLGILGCDTNQWNDQVISKNPFFCPDKSMIKLWEKYLLGVRKSGSSCGAVIEIRARGIPVGLGAPIYSKLDTDIASSLMSINAVKGVNIGAGMNSAQLSGEQNSDEVSSKGNKLKFNSNKAGGILGGISTGQEIVASFAVKPTSSILTSRKTINKLGKNTSISVKGRHDPCVGIRAVPIGEAMMNCVLLDHYLMNKAQCS